MLLNVCKEASTLSITRDIRSLKYIMLHVVKTDIKPKPNYVLTRGYCSCMYFAFLF